MVRDMCDVDGFGCPTASLALFWRLREEEIPFSEGRLVFVEPITDVMSSWARMLTVGDEAADFWTQKALGWCCWAGRVLWPEVTCSLRITLEGRR